MKKLDICINVGIGDLIFIKAQLDNVKNEYEEIRIHPKYELIKTYRDDSKESLVFTKELVRILFGGFPYVIDESPSLRTDNINHNILFNTYGLIPVKPNLSEYLVSGERSVIDGEYITVSTKVRELHKNIYSEFKHEFLKSLNKINTKVKIVILGERELDTNEETKIWGNDLIYCIYNDYKENCSGLIDMTSRRLLNTPNIETFKRDCNILKHAKQNIVIGYGGNFCMSVAVGNVISLLGSWTPLSKYIFEGCQSNDCFVTTEHLKFLERINTI